VTPRKLIWVGVLPPHKGGAAVSGFQMLVGLARAGHSIRSLAPITADTAVLGARFDAEHPELGVTRFHVPYEETNPGVPSSEAYRASEQRHIEDGLRALIAGDRPDVVLLGRETSAWRAPTVARQTGVPCILRIAGSFVGGALAGAYPDALLSQWIEQARLVDAIIAQTPTLEAALTRWGLGGIALIPNAVDLRIFRPALPDERLRRELRIDDGRVVVMHASTFKPQKRAIFVVESAAEARLSDPRLLYVLVGDGPDRPAVEELCRRRAVADHVRFVGWIPYERMASYLALADLVVMPSAFEAQARVYLETQACARTLVASDIPAARHVVEDGATGLLFRSDDVHDLTAVTLRAAADPALRGRIGANARERVAAAHSLEQVAARYSALIDAVVERRRGSGAGTTG
jgi:glycosyltransferase involved in cell wall biosynthesis